MVALIRRSSFVQVAAVLALVLVFGSSAYALTVTGRDIKNGTVTGRDIKDGSLGQAELSFGIAEARAVGRTDALGDQAIAPNNTFVGLSTVQGTTPWDDPAGAVNVTISYQIGTGGGNNPSTFTARASLNGTVVTPEYAQTVTAGERGVLSFQTFVDLQGIADKVPALTVEAKAEGSSVHILSVSLHLVGYESK